MLSSAVISLILNGVVTSLLAVTIFFCFKLNRRIVTLQDSKGDMAALIRKFDETTERARTSIEELQQIGSKLEGDVTESVKQANFIADDLAFMIDRGKKVATTLKQSAAEASSAPAPAASGGSKASSLTSGRKQRASERVDALLKPKPNAAQEDGVEEGAESGKEIPLRAERPGNVSMGGGNAAPRSRAEKELLDALRINGDDQS